MVAILGCGFAPGERLSLRLSSSACERPGRCSKCGHVMPGLYKNQSRLETVERQFGFLLRETLRPVVR